MTDPEGQASTLPSVYHERRRLAGHARAVGGGTQDEDGARLASGVGRLHPRRSSHAPQRLRAPHGLTVRRRLARRTQLGRNLNAASSVS
eukprot:4898033-Prorocentrum_lima.AAC.1